MKVPFVDLEVVHAPLRRRIVAAFEKCLDASSFVLGREGEAFEREFAAFQKVDFCAAVGSGTDALALAIEAAGFEPGAGVVTAPTSFFASAQAIRLAGCVPVFVDVDPATSNLDPARLGECLDGRAQRGRGSAAVAGVLAVHLYGRLADMDEIGRVARVRSVRVIEDACQAHGAERAGKRAGAFGEAAAFSFYPSKNLGALGDGGCVVTADAGLDERVRALRDYGRRAGERYVHRTAGRNSRLDEVQAAILRVKLEGLDTANRRRREIAGLYRRWLSGMDEVFLPAPGTETAEADHVYHLFVVRVPAARREGLAEHLAARGIGTAIHYPVPLHLQPALAYLGYVRGDFPVAERLASEVLSLPVYPGMTDEQARHVADSVRGFFARTD